MPSLRKVDGDDLAENARRNRMARDYPAWSRHERNCADRRSFFVLLTAFIGLVVFLALH